jgi:hypothetical protein
MKNSNLFVKVFAAIKHDIVMNNCVDVTSQRQNWEMGVCYTSSCYLCPALCILQEVHGTHKF